MATKKSNTLEPGFTHNTTNTKENLNIAGNISDLAEELAYNYFTNSFGDEYNLGIDTIREIFKDEKVITKFNERKGRIRNILIVGAGAAYDVYKAIPTGEGLIEEVKQVYEAELKTIPFLKEKFEEQEAEIKDITGQDKLYFENYLYLLSKLFVTQRELREKIKDMTGFRYSVSLFNELVAHMLKHAFLDVVVNFNFEETLDMAIKHEIGAENYHNIISDGNCVDLKQILVDGRLKMPIYIKPHGTYSHKSTLRFTNRHYFDLPNDIKKMLTDLIRGQRGKKEIQQVNIIMVGFAAESIEFNKILNLHLPPESLIYHIDYNAFTNGETFFTERHFFNDFLKRAEKIGNKPDDIYKPITTHFFTQNIRNKKDTEKPKIFEKKDNENITEDTTKHNDTDKTHLEKIKQDDCNSNQITSTLGELFSVLWRTQNDFFRIPYKPRSIARHEITSYLFYISELGLTSLRDKDTGLDTRLLEREFIKKNIETHPKYFRNRVLVELFILLNRNNGILDIAQILKGRVGIFYNRYVEAWSLQPNVSREISSIHELLAQFSDSAKLVNDNTSQNYIPLKGLLETKEYESGKSLFILQSIFSLGDFATEEIFSNKVTGITKEIVNHFGKIPLPSDAPLNNISRVDFKGLISQFDGNLIIILKEWYNLHIKNNKQPEVEILKLSRTVTLFYRLMTSDLLSNFFKYNFIINHKKFIHNGKKSESKKDTPRIMLFELFRLLSKSLSHHYFVIDPKPLNPVHRIWESFSKSKLMHTNLTRSIEFKDLFEKKWDIYLSITETGSLINFLHHLDDKDTIRQMQEKVAKRHFVIICSYESIRQLYPNCNSPQEVLEAHKKHLSVLSSEQGCIIPQKNLTVLAIPFNHHNHHLSVFLQKLTPNDLYDNLNKTITIIKKNTFNDTGEISEEKNINKQLVEIDPYFFNAVGSLYIYRSGFSNSIDPLYIGLAGKDETTTDRVYRDQLKLIDTFVAHIERAFKFEYFSNNGNKSWDKAEFLKVLWKKWIEDKAKISTEDFLTSLYQKI